jgi:hypothetical protein
MLISRTSTPVDEWTNNQNPTGQGLVPIKRSGRQPEGSAPAPLQRAGASGDG